MHAFKEISFVRLVGTRIVSTIAAIEEVAINVVPARVPQKSSVPHLQEQRWDKTFLDKHKGAICLRFAEDECFVMPVIDAAETASILAADPSAILLNEGAFSGAWLDEEQALALLARLAEWEMPSARPAFVQGAVAGIATKLWFEEGRVLFVVQTPYAHELEERLS